MSGKHQAVFILAIVTVGLSVPRAEASAGEFFAKLASAWTRFKPGKADTKADACGQYQSQAITCDKDSEIKFLPPGTKDACAKVGFEAEFADHIHNHLLRCVREAKGPDAKKVSLHIKSFSGRSFTIESIDIEMANGQIETEQTKIGAADAEFFKTFGKCWNDSFEEAAKQKRSAQKSVAKCTVPGFVNANPQVASFAQMFLPSCARADDEKSRTRAVCQQKEEAQALVYNGSAVSETTGVTEEGEALPTSDVNGRRLGPLGPDQTGGGPAPIPQPSINGRPVPGVIN